MTFLKRAALALLTPVLLGAYTVFPDLTFVPLVALVPWIVLYTNEREKRVPWLYYFVAAFLAFPLMNSPLFRHGVIAPLGMGLFLSFWWLPFAPLLSRIHRRYGLPRTLTVPVIWVAIEWLRSTLNVAHLDIHALGYTIGRYPLLVQFSDITGVYGASFLLAAVNGWIADLWFVFRFESGSIREAMKRRRIFVGGLSIVLALAAISAYGLFRLATIKHVPGPRIALVQPNTPHTGQNIVGVHLSQLLLTQEEVPAGEVDLIVWPENAILDFIHRKGVYLDDLAWMAREKGAGFLVGAIGMSGVDPNKTTNIAVLLDPEGRLTAEYDKVMLFPWTEYLPGDAFLGRWSPGLQRLQRRIVRLVRGFLPYGHAGSEIVLFELPWNGSTVDFATLICVENVYPPLPAQAGRQGAQFFLNITSEGDVSGPVQEQLLRIAVFRAVENRMSYARAGNTGISGFIDSAGRVRNVLRGPGGETIQTRGVLIDRVPLSQSRITLYSRSRDAFAKTAVLVALLAWLGTFFGNRKSGTTLLAVSLAMLVSVSCTGLPDPGGDPSRVDAALAEGRQLAREREFSRAIPRLMEACATAEGCRLAVDTLALCYEKTGSAEEAVDVFHRIAELYPSQAGRSIGLEAYFARKAGEVVRACDLYRRSLEIEPSSVVYARLANALVRLDRTNEAIVVLREGQVFDPADSQIRYLLGRYLRVAGELEEAQGVLETLLEDHPDHGSAWANLGRVRTLRGDVDGGQVAFRHAIRFDPANIEARFMLARQAFREGDHDQVRAIIRQIEAVEKGLGRGIVQE